MKTIITISGQTNGNNMLLNAIRTPDAVVEDAGFHNYRIALKTRKEAYKVMREAYKSLCNNEPEFKAGIHYSKYGTLRYDASTATIWK